MNTSSPSMAVGVSVLIGGSVGNGSIGERSDGGGVGVDASFGEILDGVGVGVTASVDESAGNVLLPVFGRRVHLRGFVRRGLRSHQDRGSPKNSTALLACVTRDSKLKRQNAE